MTLKHASQLRTVSEIDPEETRAIKYFMQGAVYCWIKNRKDEKFAARDLMGGENFDWNGTPLQVLYDRQIESGKDHQSAIDAAGKALGWLIKSVLYEDKRVFETIEGEYVAHYRWLKK